MRLIDGDYIKDWASKVYNSYNSTMATAEGKRGIDLCFKRQEVYKLVCDIAKSAPEIDPETLPIVQELIAEIADREDVSIIQHNEIHELRDTIKKLKDDIAQCKPVVHAHWVPSEDFGCGVDVYKCSKCGRKIYVPSLLCLDEMGVIKNFPYCHCGAKMDKVIEE